MGIKYRFALMIGAIVLLLGGGMTGYVTIEGWSPRDALYMTVITVATVGYREVEPLSPTGEIFTMCLIIVGLITLSACVSIFTSTLLEYRLDAMFRTRRRERRIMKLRDHYIICGAGRVGTIVAEEMRRRGTQFVIIESNRERHEEVLESYPGAHLVHGDATSDEILLRAGIERAKGLVCALQGDAENLYICLAARELSPNITIVARAELEENVLRMSKAGADSVVSPARTGAHRIIAMLTHPGLATFLDAMTNVEGVELKVEEFHIREASEFCGRSLAEAKIPQRTGLIVIAVSKAEDGRFVFNPSGATTLGRDDRIIVLGEEPKIRNLGRLIRA